MRQLPHLPHCGYGPAIAQNKTIPSEISMSGDYLKSEGNKGWIIPLPWGFDESNFPRGGEFDKNICWEGLGFD